MKSTTPTKTTKDQISLKKKVQIEHKSLVEFHMHLIDVINNKNDK